MYGVLGSLLPDSLDLVSLASFVPAPLALVDPSIYPHPPLLPTSPPTILSPVKHDQTI